MNPEDSADRRRLSRHLVPSAAFAALTLAWTFPLVRHLSTHLPGAGIGDQVDFLWNFWWMRTAVASGTDYFHTSYLFAPAGSDLTLHAHTALPALIGATVFASLPLVPAHNLVLLLSLFLNGFSAYLLAWRITRDRGAATIGGLVFGGSPFVAAHLHGHFNLASAWTIPLFALVACEAVQGRRRWAVAAGCVLGATAYIDYYFVVYEVALWLAIVVLTGREWRVTFGSPARRSLRLFIGILIALDAAVIAAILSTGGLDAPLGPIRSLRGIFNPLQVFWVLAALWLWLRFRPRWKSHPETEVPTHTARALLVMAAVFLVTAAPIVWKGVALLLRDEYVSYQYSWRSSPGGIDAATVFLGNPFHPVWGDSIQRAYRALGLNAMESTAWLGIVPVVLAAWTLRYRWHTSIVRRWTVIGSVFFVWAMGPHLMAFGTNTGVILPHALLRYVPIVANARIPGRAMVVAYLALGILAAIAVAHWRPRSGRRRLALVAIVIAVVADYLPSPFPLVAMDRPALYETLRDHPAPGAVCELPLGVRDGFTERGVFDDRVLFYQTIHGRPLAGGFVARLPRAVATLYASDPLLSALLNLSDRDGPSGGIPLPDRRLAAERLRQLGIAFVVLDRNSASPALVRYLEDELPLTPIVQEGSRSLYQVVPESAGT